jgi:5'-3' exonuclease
VIANEEARNDLIRMGITGLLGMLKEACIDVTLNDLGGTVAVIDTYCWLHKALFPVSMDVYLGKPVTTHITFCMRRVKELRQNNITPIFVFDGRDLEAKKLTEKSRQE